MSRANHEWSKALNFPDVIRYYLKLDFFPWSIAWSRSCFFPFFFFCRYCALFLFFLKSFMNKFPPLDIILKMFLSMISKHLKHFTSPIYFCGSIRLNEQINKPE